MQEFAIDFGSAAFIIIQYEEQKIQDGIFYRGEGYLSDDKSNFRKKVPPLLTFEFSRSASSWNKRTAVKTIIDDEMLSEYSTQIGNNIALGIEGYENGTDANQPIS
jgi:hypothetical protein